MGRHPRALPSSPPRGGATSQVRTSQGYSLDAVVHVAARGEAAVKAGSGAGEVAAAGEAGSEAAIEVAVEVAAAIRTSGRCHSREMRRC
jgi:hypothetical protein